MRSYMYISLCATMYQLLQSIKQNELFRYYRDTTLFWYKKFGTPRKSTFRYWWTK